MFTAKNAKERKEAAGFLRVLCDLRVERIGTIGNGLSAINAEERVLWLLTIQSTVGRELARALNGARKRAAYKGNAES